MHRLLPVRSDHGNFAGPFIQRSPDGYRREDPLSPVPASRWLDRPDLPLMPKSVLSSGSGGPLRMPMVGRLDSLVVVVREWLAWPESSGFADYARKNWAPSDAGLPMQVDFRDVEIANLVAFSLSWPARSAHYVLRAPVVLRVRGPGRRARGGRRLPIRAGIVLREVARHAEGRRQDGAPLHGEGPHRGTARRRAPRGRCGEVVSDDRHDDGLGAARGILVGRVLDAPIWTLIVWTVVR
jgi:hypothetical protein